MEFDALPSSSLDLVHHLASERTAAIIRKLVVSHKNGTITAQEALSGVASIAALSMLITDLENHLHKKD